MKKWERKNGLNKKASELLKRYEEYQNLEEGASMKEVLAYYIENKLKYNIKNFENFETVQNFEQNLYANPKNLITTKEQIQDSLNFAEGVLDFDRLGLTGRTDARSNMLILSKKIGLTKGQCEDLFYNFDASNHWVFCRNESFVFTFIDSYMRNNVNNFLAYFPTNRYTVNTTKTTVESDMMYFGIEYKIPVDDLDDDLLSEIGSQILKMPKFA